jgi:membrane protein
MTVKELPNIVKNAFQEFGEHRASTLGAALAYYAIFSIGPLLIIAIAIAGAIFGDAAARGQITSTISSSMGEAGAKTIEDIIKNAHQPGAGIVATIVGVIGLVLGAMGIFGQLKASLNQIWEVPTQKGGGIVSMVLTNALTFLMVLVIVAMLMLSLIVSAGLAALGPVVTQNVPGGALLWQVVTYAATLGIFTLTFAITFRVLPDLIISWKDVWLGAFLTALLFMLGQIGLGIYVGLTNVGSAFGAAGSLVVLLVWIYYSAQIFLFGAEVTQVYANNYGSHPKARHLALSFGRFGRRRSPDGAKREGQADGTDRVASPWFS